MMVGMTAREREIADLYDANVPNDEIAERLGLSKRYVRQVVYCLGLADTGDDSRHRKSMELSSRALLKALQREGLA